MILVIFIEFIDRFLSLSLKSGSQLLTLLPIRFSNCLLF